MNSGPEEEERARSRNYSSRQVKFQNELGTSIKLNEEFARLAGKKGPLNDFDM